VTGFLRTGGRWVLGVDVAVRNLRVRGFLAVCIGSNLCRPSGIYVNVGFRRRGDEAQAST
jgi:hypothetical protein